MKLYARRGFEWAENGLAGLWSPVSTGGTGSILLDCNPSTSNHGTLLNFTNANESWSGSRFGAVASFESTANRYFSVADSGSLRLGNALSFCAWSRPTTLGDTNGLEVFSKTTSAGTPFISYAIEWLDTQRFRVSIGTSNGFINANAATTSPLNEWSFVCGTYDQQNLRCFLNGFISSSTFQTASITYTTGSLGIGQWAASPQSTNKFIGDIAEIVLVSRVLAPSEIFQAYQAGPGGMWQDRPRRSRVYFGAAGFKAYWHRRQSQLIGGGV